MLVEKRIDKYKNQVLVGVIILSLVLVVGGIFYFLQNMAGVSEEDSDADVGREEDSDADVGREEDSDADVGREEDSNEEVERNYIKARPSQETVGYAASLQILKKLDVDHPDYVPDIDENGYVNGNDLDFLDTILLGPQFVYFAEDNSKDEEIRAEFLGFYNVEGKRFLEKVKEQEGGYVPLYLIPAISYEEIFDNVIKLRDENGLDINKDGKTNYRDVKLFETRLDRLFDDSEGRTRTVKNVLLYDINNDGFFIDQDAFLIDDFAIYDEQERERRKTLNNVNGEKRDGSENIVSYLEKLERGGHLDINGDGFFTDVDASLLWSYLGGGLSDEGGVYPGWGTSNLGIYSDSKYTRFRTSKQMVEFIESQDISRPNNNWKGEIIYPDFDFNLNNVKTFQKNGDDNDKINLFFVVEEKDENTAREEIEITLKTSYQAFFKTNPLKDNQHKFNVYYYFIEEADYFDRNIGIKNRKLSRDDPRDRRFFTVMDGVGKTNNYHFIFFSKSQDLRHETLGDLVQISLDYTDYNDAGKTFTHEMGHAIFNLLDEYSTLAFLVGANPVDDLNTINRKNCILEKDKHRWENIPGWDGQLYEGCQYTPKGIYRGTSYSIMSSASLDPEEWPEGWGPINKHYINEVLEQYS